MPFYDVSIPTKAEQTPRKTGYFLANSPQRGVKTYTPPDDDLYTQTGTSRNSNGECGKEWAAENAPELIIGGIGILASGIGIGYLLGSRQDDNKNTPTLNSLKNAALHNP